MEENLGALKGEELIKKIMSIPASVWTIYKFLLSNDRKNKSPNLREVIIATREILGLTQEQMAKLFEIKQNALSRYESGKRKVPIDIYAGAVELLGYELVMKKRKEKFGKDDEMVKEYEEDKKQW